MQFNRQFLAREQLDRGWHDVDPARRRTHDRHGELINGRSAVAHREGAACHGARLGYQKRLRHNDKGSHRVLIGLATTAIKGSATAKPAALAIWSRRGHHTGMTLQLPQEPGAGVLSAEATARLARTDHVWRRAWP